MREITNDCVGCPPEMGCLGSACPYQNVEHIYCDKCHREIDDDEEVYTYVGYNDICINCYNKLINEEED